MNVISAARGHYEASFSTAQADVVIGHSFGTSTDEGSPNRALADYIEQHAGDRMVVVDRTLADAFASDRLVDYVVEGPRSNAVGQGVGTWGTLLVARRFMLEEDLQTAMQVGQAHHIGRIMMQANKLGIPSLAPVNLPREFDAETKEQNWTRNERDWLRHEVGGSVVLWLQGKHKWRSPLEFVNPGHAYKAQSKALAAIVARPIN